MRESLVGLSVVGGCLLTLAAPLLLLPIFAAEARTQTTPVNAAEIESLLRVHDARFVMRAYSRVPLQCATELHGA